MMNRFWYITHFLILFIALKAKSLGVHETLDDVTYVARDIFDDSNETDIDNSLAFLNRFILKDSEEDLMSGNITAETKISKQSLKSSSVPNYMMYLYEYLLGKEYKVIFDTARSFRCTGTRIRNLHFSDNSKEGTFSRELTFNISNIPVSENIQFVQLRIQTQSSISEEKLGVELKAHLYSTKNDEVEQVAFHDTVLLKKLLLSFDVTEFFRNLTDFERQTLKLEIAISPQNIGDFFIWDTTDAEGPQMLLLSGTDEEVHEIENPFLKHIERLTSEKIIDSSENDAVKDSFDKKMDGKIKESSAPLNRAKRNDEQEEFDIQSKFILGHLRQTKNENLSKKNNCKRKPYIFNFADINFDHWILAPPSYEAFRCSGKCFLPTSVHLAPALTAIIQAANPSLEPKRNFKACCVPTKLKSISILFLEDEETVVYRRNIVDMVIEECGCL